MIDLQLHSGLYPCKRVDCFEHPHVQHALQRGTAVPDAATYRTAVDTMVAAGNYAAAAALCGDAHEAGTFCHYTLPPVNQGAQSSPVRFALQHTGCVLHNLSCPLKKTLQSA